MGIYSSGSEPTLPSDTTDLTDHTFDSSDYTSISLRDSNRVSQAATSEYSIFQFKQTVTTPTAKIVWIGQSDLSPATVPVVLQVYKVAATAGWVTINSNSTAAADTDFDLTTTLSTATTPALSACLDSGQDSGVLTCRVYQNSIIDWYLTYVNDTGSIESSNWWGMGQSITGNDKPLNQVQFYMKKFAAPTGNAIARLYNLSGTWGNEDNKPGSLITSSNTVDVTNIGTSYAWIPFTFPTPYTLVNGTHYVITMEFNGGDFDKYLLMGYHNLEGTHAGNMCGTTDLSTWSAFNGSDLMFKADP